MEKETKKKVNINIIVIITVLVLTSLMMVAYIGYMQVEKSTLRQIKEKELEKIKSEEEERNSKLPEHKEFTKEEYKKMLSEYAKVNENELEISDKTWIEDEYEKYGDNEVVAKMKEEYDKKYKIFVRISKDEKIMWYKTITSGTASDSEKTVEIKDLRNKAYEFLRKTGFTNNVKYNEETTGKSTSVHGTEIINTDVRINFEGEKEVNGKKYKMNTRIFYLTKANGDATEVVPAVSMEISEIK